MGSPMERPRATLDTLARNVILTDDLRPVVSACRERGIPLVALKGLALIHSVYAEDLGARSMSDADLLVPPERGEEAECVLASFGYRRIPGHQATFTGGRGTPPTRIDLQTGIWYLGPDQVRAFIERSSVPEAVAHERAGLRIAVPAVEDHLLLIATHAVLLHGQLRPVWLEDLRRLAEAGPDWETVIAGAREHGLSTPLHAALVRARAYGSAVPEETLTALRPRGTERARAALIDRMLGRPETPEAGHFLRFLFRPGIGGKFRAAQKHLFPGTEFLRRRYRAESTLEVLAHGAVRPAASIGRSLRLAARMGLGRRKRAGIAP